ncbi:MAG TPA: protein-L-isoaspartate O-methyltransferase [Micropepsaceae bacterium]|nr:protein-L-isoaspartate O-methyltransferase [Micropepsaceae bacterium]
MLDTAAQRANMVAAQLRPNDVTDARIRDAMLSIPRERFVPAGFAPVAYMEGCIPLGRSRVLLDPRCLAKLLQLAAVGPNDRVLDVACGTGYSTAILSLLGREVVALEEDSELAARAKDNLQSLGLANARVVCGSLVQGLPQDGPFDVIFVNGAVSDEPKQLLAQLRDGGRLATIARNGAAGHAILYLNHEGALGERRAFDASVPVLPGFQKPPSFVF